MALPPSEVIFTSDEVEAAIARVAAEVERDFASKAVRVVTVLNGGLFFAAALAQKLSLSLSMDYVHVSRYVGEAGGDDLTWYAWPSLPLAGQHILLIDDVLDQGPTLDALLGFFRKQGTASVEAAVLIEKQLAQRSVAITPRYVGLSGPDRYLFGWGMDYRGGFRQLRDIRALTE